MFHVSKLKVIFTIIATVFLTFFQYLYSDVIQIEGEMNSSITAYITKRFTSYKDTKNLTYILCLPPSSTEGISTQTISNLRQTFTPYPTGLKEVTDEYGNKRVELIWNKNIRIVQIDLQFNAKIYSNYYLLSSQAPFPVIIDQSQEVFLTSSDLSPSYDFFINYIGRTISGNLSREIDVVNSIFLWIDRNIRLANQPEDNTQYDALTVLKMRKGSSKGICNLACSLFKGIGIPARVVYGLSFQKEIEIEAENQRIIYDLPNDERYWVEVYFPDIGWMSYDPHGMYFGVTSHAIKLSHGPDSDYASETWSIEQGEVSILKDFIYDIKSDFSEIEFKGYGIDNIDKLIMSPIVADFTLNSDEPDLDIEGLQEKKEIDELNPGAGGIVLHNSDISKRLDIVATRNRVYAQKFTIEFPITLQEVILPLLKFSDEGKIWVEIFSDNNGKPDKNLFRTYTIRSTVVRYLMEDNPWLSFPVGKKTASFLKSGNYWLALRSSGSCIFNWNAYEGNVIGDSRDTRFMDVKLKKPHWNNILNLDLKFQIIGKREEEINEE